MKIRISTIRISGFRGLKNLELELPRVTVLIGTNNSGKTSMLKAFSLALGDYSRFLSEEDFYIGEDEKRSPEIIVDVKIVPVDEDNAITKLFDDDWTTEFGDKIRSEAAGQQYVALRSRSGLNLVKGKFETSRYVMEKWPEFKEWNTVKIKESKTGSIASIPFISIDAQRDLYKELKEKSSFVGRVLSGVEYKKEDIENLEKQIKVVNEDAVKKSTTLQSLKTHLEKLSESFKGAGSAEITPFPKKIRDLSKNFTVHVGESASGTFSMEYHGMGTRSWASMLTVKAFADIMLEKHEKESEPFFPVLAAEEPEAHLHPNAQKTLYRQLVSSKGQVIVSTHSPYLAAMANQDELRYLRKVKDDTKVYTLSLKRGTPEYLKLHREVIHSRGELLFSQILILCEGETEEQVLPILFTKYFGKEPNELGINFVGVRGSGKQYLPHLTLSRDYNIPCFIFSDGESKVVGDLKKNYEQVFGKDSFSAAKNIVVISNGDDFEAHLLQSGFKKQIEEALTVVEGKEFINSWIEKRQGTPKGSVKAGVPPCVTCGQNIMTGTFRDYTVTGGYELALNEIIDSGKSKYGTSIADEICKLENDKFPPAVIELFKKLNVE